MSNKISQFDEELAQMAFMWTDRKDDHLLVVNTEAPAHLHKYSPFELSGGQLLLVLIEDDMLAREVQKRMLNAGVRVVSSTNEALSIARSRATSSGT